MLDQPDLPKDDLNHSVLLDVHTHSDYPEVNVFVDEIHSAHFSDPFTGAKKKNLKVVLLHLFVAWSEDSSLYTAVSFNKNDYKAGSRYNSLHISEKIITIIKKMDELGLIELHLGFKDWRPGGHSRVTRIRPLQKLISHFQKATFSTFEINTHEDRESVILKVGRRKDSKKVGYEDTEETVRMRAFLREYNQLLQNNHIDCCSLDKPYETRWDKKSKRHRKVVRINDQNKFTSRSFARGSWSHGGRFYGGWWQNISRELRPDIRINGERTIEIDFSGTHITFLYAEKGINYFSEIGDDPYDIPIREINDPEKCRWLVKQLFLNAINAKTPEKAFQAVMEKANKNKSEAPQIRLTFEFLERILDQIKQKHPLIAEDLCSDRGVSLMFYEGQITERVLQHFMNKGVVALSIHDSYVVPESYSDELREVMNQAWAEVLGFIPDDSERALDALYTPYTKTKQIGYTDELLGKAELYESPRYQQSLRLFWEWKGRER